MSLLLGLVAAPFISSITEGFSFPKLTKSLLSPWQGFIFPPASHLLAHISPAGRFRTFIYPLSSPASHHPIPSVYYLFHPQAVNNFEGDQAAAWESAGWQQPGAGGVPGLTHNRCWRILESTGKKNQILSQTCQNYQLPLDWLKNHELKGKKKSRCSVYLIAFFSCF